MGNPLPVVGRMQSLVALFVTQVAGQRGAVIVGGREEIPVGATDGRPILVMAVLIGEERIEDHVPDKHLQRRFHVGGHSLAPFRRRRSQFVQAAADRGHGMFAEFVFSLLVRRVGRIDLE